MAQAKYTRFGFHQVGILKRKMQLDFSAIFKILQELIFSFTKVTNIHSHSDFYQ